MIDRADRCERFDPREGKGAIAHRARAASSLSPSPAPHSLRHVPRLPRAFQVMNVPQLHCNGFSAHLSLVASPLQPLSTCVNPHAPHAVEGVYAAPLVSGQPWTLAWADDRPEGVPVDASVLVHDGGDEAVLCTVAHGQPTSLRGFLRACISFYDSSAGACGRQSAAMSHRGGFARGLTQSATRRDRPTQAHAPLEGPHRPADPRHLCPLLRRQLAARDHPESGLAPPAEPRARPAAHAQPGDALDARRRHALEPDDGPHGATVQQPREHPRYCCGQEGTGRLGRWAREPRARRHDVQAAPARA